MRRSPATLRAIFVLAVLVAAAPGNAQERRADSLLTVEKYLDFEQVADPQISPDGTQIVYTRRWVNTLEDKWDSALWIVGADGSRNRFFAKGSSPLWAPDGTRIAYLAEGEPRGMQIHVKYVDAEGAPTQATRLTDAPADLRWSPDGKWIGFTSFIGRPPEWKISMPAPPKGAKWTNPPRVVERMHFRQDRRGFSETGYTHLFVVPAEGGSPRQVTSGNFDVGARWDGLAGPVSWSWMPDGKSAVIEAFTDSTADRSYRETALYAVDVATGAMRRLTPDSGAWRAPLVSPDGRRIAYIGHPATRRSEPATELYVMNADGSGARMLTPGLDREPTAPHWAPDGAGIYFSAGDRGSVNVFYAPADGRAGARPVTSGAQVLALTSLSRTGVGAGVRSTPNAPPDVVRIDLGGGSARRRGAAPAAVPAAAVTQLTRVNDDLLARVKLGQVEELWYPSSGGARVHGWVVKPPNFEPGRKYPLIFEIHGGPHSMYTTAFNYSFQNFAANGYLVLYTNPRGSTGYGNAFANAIERAYPGVDYDDLMAAVDTVIGRGLVDTTRMFVGGCSGGGILSSWVIGHTNRFAAAAVRCPVANWLSMAGETDIPLFAHNFFEKPFWEDPKPWLERSPIMYVGNVKTPTLIMTGELDLRTPMAQSEEYYAALKLRGVPTALLRFEGEYHGTASKPSNFMRTQLYMMSWYERWGGKSGRTTAAAVPE
jgi:dipeptidyl aminopeptidase/acylaminoacyl peptidase